MRNTETDVAFKRSQRMPASRQGWAFWNHDFRFGYYYIYVHISQNCNVKLEILMLPLHSPPTHTTHSGTCLYSNIRNDFGTLFAGLICGEFTLFAQKHTRTFASRAKFTEKYWTTFGRAHISLCFLPRKNGASKII